MIGQTISHYEVVEKIGQGGMGKFFRAENTNLSPEVAIQVLPKFGNGILSMTLILFLTAVGLAQGTEKWHFVTGGPVFWSSPAIGTDGTLYVGSWDFNLYAINPDGTQKWAFPTGGVVFSSPAIGTDGTLYVGSDDGSLYAINPDGTEMWAFPT